MVLQHYSPTDRPCSLFRTKEKYTKRGFGLHIHMVIMGTMYMNGTETHSGYEIGEVKRCAWGCFCRSMSLGA